MQETTDDTKKPWFKRKIYGWGWYPATWQGWLVTLAYVVVIFAAAATVDDGSPAREVIFTFVLPLVLATGAFIRIAYRTGEKPRWQWGRTKSDEAERK
ncbi:MAG: hypothetical protein Q8L64_03645 [bacterium]|nr:hypothetical protein [bacterium]